MLPRCTKLEGSDSWEVAMTNDRAGLDQIEQTLMTYDFSR